MKIYQAFFLWMRTAVQAKGQVVLSKVPSEADFLSVERLSLLFIA